MTITAVKEATYRDYMDIVQKGPFVWQESNTGEFHYEGWVFYEDEEHAGEISTTPDVVEKYGLTDSDVFVEGDLEYFHVCYDWKSPSNKYGSQDPAEDPEGYTEALAEFKAQRYCRISHCFWVVDPEGNELGYGKETPFGIIGSEPFTCWWNGFPHVMLAECDINSWCDG